MYLRVGPRSLIQIFVVFTIKKFNSTREDFSCALSKVVSVYKDIGIGGIAGERQRFQRFYEILSLFLY